MWIYSIWKSGCEKYNMEGWFSGGGGSSCGYTQAGGKVLLACEIDDNAVETYKLNYPQTPIYHGDIKNLTYDKIHEITGINKGELDILDGSPPCQGFSACGKREYNDPKNQLYNQYIRLLRELKPKTFIMENVQGLIQGEMKLIFKDILTQLKKSGYIVTAKIMHCEYYNNPTTRKRLIIIAIANSLLPVVKISLNADVKQICAFAIISPKAAPKSIAIPSLTLFATKIKYKAQIIIAINANVPRVKNFLTFSSLCSSGFAQDTFCIFIFDWKKGLRASFTPK